MLDIFLHFFMWIIYSRSFRRWSLKYKCSTFTCSVALTRKMYLKLLMWNISLFIPLKSDYWSWCIFRMIHMIFSCRHWSDIFWFLYKHLNSTCDGHYWENKTISVLQGFNTFCCIFKFKILIGFWHSLKKFLNNVIWLCAFHLHLKSLEFCTFAVTNPD